MTISLTDSLVPNVVYKPINPSSNDASTFAKVKRVSIKEEELGSSSSHAITVRSLNPLLGEVTEEGKPSSEISVDKTQSIFNRFFCCFKK